MTVYAATGHRPDKLGGHGIAVAERLVSLAHRFLSRTPDVTSAISGMALGWDQAWTQACCDRGIPFVAAVPFRGQELFWPKESQAVYHSLLGKAAEVVVVCPGEYAPWKMRARNRWMIKRTDKVVALYDGSEGGTAHCVRCAKEMGREVINLWSEYVQSSRS